MEVLNNIRKSQTFRLRKTSQSFLEGVALVLDTKGTAMGRYNVDRTDNEADFKALDRDWKAVAEDMYFALDKHARGQ